MKIRPMIYSAVLSLMLSFLVSPVTHAFSSGAPNQPGRIELPPVTGFDLKAYLGTWYEIARITKSFEEGCHCVTADYSLRSDGAIDVKNTCFKIEGQNGKLKKSVANGRAKFATSDTTVGDLKVSFFLPSLPIAYGNYRIVELVDGGKISLVSNKSGTTFWLLARSPSVSRKEAEELALRVAPSFKKDYRIDYDIQAGCTY
jgi:apolipoprotein D and lipocalin family protein